MRFSYMYGKLSGEGIVHFAVVVDLLSAVTHMGKDVIIPRGRALCVHKLCVWLYVRNTLLHTEYVFFGGGHIVHA